jgi:antitoxin MazE
MIYKPMWISCIDQVKLGNEVEIVVQHGHLVIRPVSRPRSGWDEQFRAMAENSDDQLLDKTAATKWDRSDWVW